MHDRVIEHLNEVGADLRETLSKQPTVRLLAALNYIEGAIRELREDERQAADAEKTN